MEFLGISFWEFLLIVVVIVVVVGPAKIPGIMRTLGTIIRNIRKTTSELTTSITREIELDNARKAGESPPPAAKKTAADFLPKHLPSPPETDRSKHDEQ
jgi:sec-independent protein translocase protein TatB